MAKNDDFSINIHELADTSAITVQFQPVVSVVKKSVIGLDGISTGAAVNNKFIPMTVLSDKAESQDISIDLDRLIRERIVEKFISIYNEPKESILLLNIDMAVIAKFVGSGILMNLVNKYNLDPKNVVLNIYINDIVDEDILKQFINTYRYKGFLVALCIGSRFANLDKISHVEPDIIKISSSITKDIDMDYYKQEIFKSLVSLSKKISALVIAEGIETEVQALITMELGADMLQGNYFSEFKEISLDNIKSVEDKVKQTASRYKKYMIEQIDAEKTKHKEYEAILNSVIHELSIKEENKFNDILNDSLNKYDAFECIYVLDESGIQVSDTVTHVKNMLAQKALIFKPAKKGTDHSLKKYYYFLKNMGLNKYVTDPYISLATGNLCLTISEKFKGLNKKNYILCIDFNPNYISI